MKHYGQWIDDQDMEKEVDAANMALAATLSKCQQQMQQQQGQRTGGVQRLQPVFCIVCQASIALCRSIRLRVIGSGGRGGTWLYVLMATH